MRVINSRDFTFHGISGPTLRLGGSSGEIFEVGVLDEGLVRFRFLPDGKPRLHRTWAVAGLPSPDAGDDGGIPPLPRDVPVEGRSREDLSVFPCPPFDHSPAGRRHRLSTAGLSVDIDPETLTLRWHDGAGRCFAEDLPTKGYAYDREGTAVFHYIKRMPGESYYGLGERCGPLDKRGMRFRMVNVDALGYDAESTDPLYKHWPFYMTFVPGPDLFYGLFYDTPAACEFDLGKEIDAYHGDYRYFTARHGDIDAYMVLGPGIKDVVRRFFFLIGGMNLPPRWSLGYLGSSMAYAEAPEAQKNLKRFIEQCSENRIPCHGFHLSSGYTLGKDGKRYVFTWNRDRFPEPAVMTEEYHRAGMRMAANIKPCLLKEHPSYAEVESFKGFVRAAEGDGPELSMFWGGEGSYLDFTNPETFEWWKSRVREKLLAYGIDGTWNDNNEYEIWDDAARCHGFADPLPIGLARPIQTLLMARASWEAQLAEAPNLRPYLISRSGCPGFQRYAQTWSGDNSTSWNSLKYNIPMGLGLSLSGCPNTGHDIGGFYGPEPDPELFLRWVQSGILNPRFSIHSWRLDGTSNEPWMHPEVLPLVREALEFRYRLLPYMYSLIFETVRRGDPVIRPLLYEFPGDPRCRTESFAFLLGPNLLAAPLTEPGARRRRVYLPSGTAWIEVPSGLRHEGGKDAEVEAPLEKLPLFAPEGAVIPLGEVPAPGGPLKEDRRFALVFPHRKEGRGTFTLIEDDGLTLDYVKGAFTEVILSVESRPDQIILEAKTGRRGYPLPYREIEFILPPEEDRPVCGGKENGTDAEGRRRAAVHILS